VKALNYVSVAVALISGIATILLLFVVPVNAITFESQSGLTILLGWVTTLAAVALLVGIINLLSVHFNKAAALNLNSAYSLIFLLTFAVVMFMWFLGAIAKLPQLPPGQLRDNLILYGDGTVNFAFKYIQTPVEASLAAVLAVVLVLAGIRLIRRQQKGPAIVFMVVSLILIIGLAPPTADVTFLSDLREGINKYLAVGAARGIILGVSLGVVATGLRVIFGLDQPAGE